MRVGACSSRLSLRQLLWLRHSCGESCCVYCGRAMCFPEKSTYVLATCMLLKLFLAFERACLHRASHSIRAYMNRTTVSIVGCSQTSFRCQNQHGMADGSPLQLLRVPTLRLEDPKVEWRINESDIIDINGVPFVLLRKGRTSHSGFARLVYSMVGLEDRTWTLSTSVGYKDLQKRRNDDQRANLETSMLDKMPTWQRSTAKVKVGRNTRSKLQELSEHRGVLSITVPGVNDDEGSRSRL